MVLDKGLLSKDQLAMLLRPEVLTTPQPITVPVEMKSQVSGRGTTDIDVDVPVHPALETTIKSDLPGGISHESCQ